MEHRIEESGEQEVITEAQAKLLLDRDLIYRCDTCGSEGATVYHHSYTVDSDEAAWLAIERELLGSP